MITAEFISRNLVNQESFIWNDRVWISQHDAVPSDETFTYLRGRFFSYDSESARNYADNGGTFDIHHIRGDKFHTFTVVKGYAGVMRLFVATDIRELRDGQVW